MTQRLITTTRWVLVLVLIAHTVSFLTALSLPLGFSLPWTARLSGGAFPGPAWIPYVFVLPQPVYAYAIYRLWQLLGEFDRGQHFSVAAVGHLRGFAAAFIFAVGFCQVAEIVPGLYAQPPSFSLNPTHLLDVALAFALFLIAQGFVRARRTEQELDNIL